MKTDRVKPQPIAVILPLLNPQLAFVRNIFTLAPVGFKTLTSGDAEIQLLASLIVTVYAPANSPVNKLLL